MTAATPWFATGFFTLLGSVLLLVGVVLLVWLLGSDEQSDWYDRARKVRPTLLEKNSHPLKGLLAIDSFGNILVPAGVMMDGTPLWLETFRPTHPRHLRVWAHSRLANTVVFLEEDEG